MRLLGDEEVKDLNNNTVSEIKEYAYAIGPNAKLVTMKSWKRTCWKPANSRVFWPGKWEKVNKENAQIKSWRIIYK